MITDSELDNESSMAAIVMDTNQIILHDPKIFSGKMSKMEQTVYAKDKASQSSLGRLYRQPPQQVHRVRMT